MALGCDRVCVDISLLVVAEMPRWISLCPTQNFQIQFRISRGILTRSGDDPIDMDIFGGFSFFRGSATIPAIELFG